MEKEKKKQKTSTKSKEPCSVSMVAYTDGSGRNALCSYGFHYYVYNTLDLLNEPKSKPTFGNAKADITNFGLVTATERSEKKAKYLNAKHVVPINYFVGRCNMKDTTNNFMELYSIYKTLEHFYNYITETGHKPYDILIRTDSQVSIQRITNMFKETNQNMDIPLRDEFKDIYSKLEIGRKCRISIEHVYGHSSSVGNQFADRLAFSCGERTEEFEEVVDMTSTWNKLIDVGIYNLGNKVHIMSGDRLTILVDKYKKGDSIGDRKEVKLVGLLLPDEMPEPYKSLYEKYKAKGDDTVIDVKFDIRELRNRDTSFLHNACGVDAYNIAKFNPKWLKVCDMNTAVVGGNIGALGIVLHNNLMSMMDRVFKSEHICAIDIKDKVLKSMDKKKNTPIAIDVSLKEHIQNSKLGTISITDVIEKKLKKVKEFYIFPNTDVPQVTFILNILGLDDDSKFHLIVEDVNEIRLSYYFYLESKKYKFKSVWCDNNTGILFFKD